MAFSSGNSKRARQAAWLFGIGGIIILAAGVLRLRGMLYQPFTQRAGTGTTLNEDLFGASALDPKLDTDKDGLSDLEEQNRYGTSPYIADTDSDGMSDGEEVLAGTNPTCPKGTDCASPAPTQGSILQKPGDLLGPGPALPLGGGGVNPGSLANLLGLTPAGQDQTNVDAKTAREQLKQAGITSAVLDKLDDAAVLDLYRTTVANLGVTPNQISASSPTQGMTPQELRALLIRSGVDSKLLEQLTDAQVVQVVEETLNKKSK